MCAAPWWLADLHQSEWIFISDSWELITESQKLMDQIFSSFITGRKVFHIYDDK